MPMKIATDMCIELMAFTPLKTMKFIAHSLRHLHNFLYNREVLVRTLSQRDVTVNYLAHPPWM